MEGPSLLTRLRARVLIIVLKLTQRIVLSRFFRIVLVPVLIVFRLVWAVRIVFGHSPVIDVPGNSAITAELATMIAKLEESRRTRVIGEMTDRGRDLVQTMTWGTAGVAVLILVAIATSSKTFTGPSMTIAAGCFAVSVPLFISFGFAFAHQWDPGRDPPTTQEVLNLNALIYGGQFLFALGLASLLWSFDYRVSLAFLVACCLASRVFKNLVVNRISPQVAQDVSAMIQSAVSSAAASDVPRESVETESNCSHSDATKVS
jgi:hypothetical protein